MNCGSIAIALSAEYGDVSPGGISLIGSSCSTRCPARAQPRGDRLEVADLADAPAARRGIENSGTQYPARRDRSAQCHAVQRSAHCEAAASHSPSSKTARSRRQQADDDERLARKVEEVARMHEHALALEQIEHQLPPRLAWPAREPPPTSRLRLAAPRTAGCRAAATRSAARLRADPRLDRRANRRAARAAAPAPRPAPACPPTGKLSAISSRARKRGVPLRRRAADDASSQASPAAAPPTSTGRRA